MQISPHTGGNMQFTPKKIYYHKSKIFISLNSLIQKKKKKKHNSLFLLTKKRANLRNLMNLLSNKVEKIFDA